MTPENSANYLKDILGRYRDSFSGKSYKEENEDHDPLMDMFGITPSLKRENRQYWGRELGMCWQLLVCETFRLNCREFQPAIRIDDDEPCDCRLDGDAIDTKYRVGSGDSGTLKKFKQYGALFHEMKLRPVLLFLRKDNLPAAITACTVGGWTILTGEASFAYIREKSGVDLQSWMSQAALSKEYFISR